MTEIDKTLCDTCGQPLFLDTDECKRFIEEKMKEGYIVCSCCGVRKKVERE
jgi:hypothetical protein